MKYWREVENEPPEEPGPVMIAVDWDDGNTMCGFFDGDTFWNLPVDPEEFDHDPDIVWDIPATHWAPMPQFRRDYPVGVPDSVVVECTPSDYTIAVFSGSTPLSMRRYVMESPGRSRGERPGDVCDDLEHDFEQLADEVDDLQMHVFGIAQELHKLSEREE